MNLLGIGDSIYWWILEFYPYLSTLQLSLSIPSYSYVYFRFFIQSLGRWHPYNHFLLLLIVFTPCSSHFVEGQVWLSVQYLLLDKSEKMMILSKNYNLYVYLLVNMLSTIYKLQDVDSFFRLMICIDYRRIYAKDLHHPPSLFFLPSWRVWCISANSQ